MSVYGNISSSINISNGSPSSGPVTMNITTSTDPGQDGVDWSMWISSNTPLKLPLNVAAGQSESITYTINYSWSGEDVNISPYTINFELQCTVNGQAVSVPGWMQLYTDPCGVVERPDNVYLSLSIGGQPAQVSSQSQPPGAGNPDPFVINISVKSTTLAQGNVDGILVTCAETVLEKILEGMIE